MYATITFAIIAANALFQWGVAAPTGQRITTGARALHKQCWREILTDDFETSGSEKDGEEAMEP